MILFYTGSIKPNTEQKDPNLSLGGYISSSIVPNGSMNNLFSTIGLTDLKNNKDEIRIIALKNISGADVNDLKIWFDSDEDSFAKIQLGVALPMYDGDGGCQFFEMLQDQYCSPYYTTFDDYQTEDNAYEFSGVFEKNAVIGLFLKRQLIPENNPDMGGKFSSCDTLYQEWLDAQADPDAVPKTSDDITMSISWS